MAFATRIVQSIDEVAAEGALASHPFIDAWQAGTLSRDDLRAFATQYFHHVESFPRYVSALHSRTDDAATRRVLVDVLADLERRTPTLSDLWLQTCAAVGLFSDSVRRAERTHPTEACVNDFFWLCQEGTVSGLAALYVALRQVPAACRAQSAALIDHYGVNSGPGLEYFDVAAYAAGHHAQMLRDAMAALIASDDLAREATGAANAAVTALRGLFAGAMPVATA